MHVGTINSWTTTILVLYHSLENRQKYTDSESESMPAEYMQVSLTSDGVTCMAPYVAEYAVTVLSCFTDRFRNLPMCKTETTIFLSTRETFQIINR